MSDLSLGSISSENSATSRTQVEFGVGRGFVVGAGVLSCSGRGSRPKPDFPRELQVFARFLDRRVILQFHVALHLVYIQPDGWAREHDLDTQPVELASNEDFVLHRVFPLFLSAQDGGEPVFDGVFSPVFEFLCDQYPLLSESEEVGEQLKIFHNSPVPLYDCRV